VEASGKIRLLVGDDLMLDTTGFGSGAQVGHAARRGDLRGDIKVFVADDVDLVDSGSLSSTRIGHGGPAFRGNAVGDICVFSGDDVLLDARNPGTFAQIGHGGRDASGGTLAGFIGVYALDNLSIRAVPGALSLIGHGGPGTTSTVAGDGIVLAYDQQRPLGLGSGGRFTMTDNTRIGGPQGAPVDGPVMIFGSRLVPPIGPVVEAVDIADGAVINGIAFNSNIFEVPRGVLDPGRQEWNTNYPLWIWEHEQYEVTLDRFCGVPSGLNYTGPFTFFYIDPGIDPALVRDFQQTAHDRWERIPWNLVPSLPYFMYYGEEPTRPAEELTGLSSYEVFGSFQ
jgi:hypothetical protein